MTGPILYSVNSFVKFFIQQEYRQNVHYVWCSPYYDGRKAPVYSSASLVGRSSNPADIYRELQRDVESSDHHSKKIAEQKNTLTTLATTWHASSEITDFERDEILALVNEPGFKLWRPLIYVIPRPAVENRLTLVARTHRAATGAEFIIPDLARNEFDVIEVDCDCQYA